MKDRKLVRSVDDKMFAGVAGGLAEYFEIDPVIIRLLFVIIALFGGGFVGILIYIMLWIIMPEATTA